jgi:hypothetical protein
MPTVDEFLQYKPIRQAYEWTEDKEGHVSIKVPKFTSNLGKTFCKLIRKNQIFEANMDDIGSVVWKMSTGKHTVKDILRELEKHHKDEKDLDQRLFLFLQQMKSLNYIEF